METLHLNRFSPLKLRNGRSLKNRVVVPPMASGNASADGHVTLASLEHYGRLAQSGAGLVIAEYTFVHLSGRSEDNQLGIQDDSHIAGLTDLAETIHLAGALAGLQITHGGGKSDQVQTGRQLMGPSGIRVPVKGEELEIPRAMTAADVALWRESFVAGTRRAVQSGFDLVEFHSAHGYGLNQFLSPITNQRDDEYGGSLVNRARLLMEIVSEVRVKFPGLLISVRIPGQDFLEGGLSPGDMIEVAKRLEAAGVDIIHVSSGIGGWRRPAPRIGEGYLVAEASEIQSQLAIPVIGVGGIETGEYIDRSLQERKFSLAAVGRAILNAAGAWGEENLSLNRRGLHHFCHDHNLNLGN